MEAAGIEPAQDFKRMAGSRESPAILDEAATIFRRDRSIAEKAGERSTVDRSATPHSRGRSCAAARPCPKYELTRAREADVEKSSFLIERRFATRNDFILKSSDDRGAYRQAFRAPHGHHPDALALSKRTILPQR